MAFAGNIQTKRERDILDFYDFDRLVCCRHPILKLDITLIDTCLGTRLAEAPLTMERVVSTNMLVYSVIRFKFLHDRRGETFI